MESYGVEGKMCLWQIDVYVIWELLEVGEVLMVEDFIGLYRYNYCKFGLDNIFIV